ncbi:hypothetical protein ACFVVX_15885 [Kitasatospora sp. NPDC058170]|uniref:hypothetical protein n=1 Tax=Kitasatospora sp. NPDC058170 TaxID=3346364 RepID=UPI0036DECC6E
MTTSDAGDDRYTHFRFGHEPQPSDPAPATLAVPHPGPLNPRGILITCAMCAAERDWLLIHVHPDLVFVRCRCAHEWRERDLEASDVEASRDAGGDEQEWESFEEMYAALGFDGLLRGAYFA